MEIRLYYRAMDSLSLGELFERVTIVVNYTITHIHMYTHTHTRLLDPEFGYTASAAAVPYSPPTTTAYTRMDQRSSQLVFYECV